MSVTNPTSKQDGTTLSSGNREVISSPTHRGRNLEHALAYSITKSLEISILAMCPTKSKSKYENHNIQKYGLLSLVQI